MFRLLRSDTYRLVRGKMVWVIPIVAIAWICFMTYITWYSIETFGSDLFGDSSSALIDAVTGKLTQTLDLTSQFGTTLITGGGILVVLVSVFAALVSVSDTDTGFIKGLFPVRRGRLSYYVEKFVLIALFCLLLIALSAAALYAAMTFAGFGFAWPAWEATLRWFAVVWFLLCGYAFLTASVGWLTHSKAAACVFAILLSTSVVGTILLGVFMVMPESEFSRNALQFLRWMPFQSLMAVGPGVAAFDPAAGAPISASDLMGVFSYSLIDVRAMGGAAVLEHVLKTAGGMCAIAFVVTFLLVLRRDVRA